MELTRSATRSSGPAANERGSDSRRSEYTGHQHAFDNTVRGSAGQPPTVPGSSTAHADTTAPDDDMPESSAAAAARVQARRHYETPQYSSEPHEKLQPDTGPGTAAPPQQGAPTLSTPQQQAAHAADLGSQLSSLSPARPEDYGRTRVLADSTYRNRHATGESLNTAYRADLAAERADYHRGSALRRFTRPSPTQTTVGRAMGSSRFSGAGTYDRLAQVIHRDPSTVTSYGRHAGSSLAGVAALSHDVGGPPLPDQQERPVAGSVVPSTYGDHRSDRLLQAAPTDNEAARLAQPPSYTPQPPSQPPSDTPQPPPYTPRPGPPS